MTVRARWAIFMVGGAALAATVWFWLRPELPTPARPLGGRLELAAGPVEVERGGAFVAAVSATPLPDRGRLRTGKGARALVRMLGGGSVFLGDLTTMALSGSALSLERGRIWLDAPPAPEPVIHSCGPASVAVASAGLSIERRGDRVEVYVARGLALVSAAKGRREVSAGERALIGPAGDVKLEPVSFWDDWTGGMADRGMIASAAGAASGRLYAVDRAAPPGTPARPLEIKRQAVRSRIADGIAETEVDQTFFNPGERPVEGFYWFTLPESAIVTGFALETNGVLVEGEVVERKQAVATYEASIERASDPALLEWINGRTYRARIHPVAAIGTRRVLLRYVEPVLFGDGRIRYVYPMAQAESEAPAIDEFSLTLELGELGREARISTLPDARIEDGGRRISMRRSVYTPRADFQLELVPHETPAPLRATRFDAGGDQADFVMLRWLPDVDWSAIKLAAAELVVAVDTSAGGDEADRQLKLAVAEAILRSLSAGDRFAVVTADVTPRVIYPQSGLAPASEAELARALELLASRAAGGATDLGALFDPALSRLHGAEQPALVYIGDGQATTGELGGAELVERLRRSLEASRTRFFTIGVGAEANHALLERLAAVGGGAHYRVDGEQQAVAEALRLTAAVKTPTITDLELDLGVGLDEPLANAAGKLARGQELMLLARTHHDLPGKATIRGRLGGKPFSREYELAPERGAATQLVPRLWAAEFVRRMIGRAAQPDDARGKVVALALDYGLVTPFSSILALDSEAAYERMGISRRRRPWDRLPLEQAALAPHGARGLFALALAPLALLSGCDGDAPEAVSTERLDRPSSVALAPVAAPAPASAAPPVAADAPQAQEESAPLSNPYRKAADRPLSAEASAASSVAERSSARIGTGYGGRRDGRRSGPRRLSVARTEPEPNPARAALADALDARIAAPRRPLAAVCSDAAARSLVERTLLWQRRLRSVREMAEALALYAAAEAACELPGYRDRRILLGLIEPLATSGSAAELLFQSFAGDLEATALLARRVLRRTLDPYVAAVARRHAHGGSLDWSQLDLELAELGSDDARVARLRLALLAAPNDAEGELRLMKFLLRAGKRDEGLALAARLRERGFLSPGMLRDFGDVLVAAGLRDEALRTYTEIVEFDPQSPSARELVGDTLLENGWYEAAYRQFRTLVDLSPGLAGAEIRLALAAAGAGRTDEALRILRGVAESEGQPGANDPRLHARLLSGAILARLLADESHNAQDAEALARRLKQLQILPTAGRLVLLTWESLDAALGFGTAEGDAVDALDVGLCALSSPTLSLQSLAQAIKLRSENPRGRPVRFTLHELAFDGKTFQIKVLNAQAG